MDSVMKITAAVCPIVGFIVALVVGKFFIPFMRKKHFGQEIREDGPRWHMSKAGTPTMGGVMFIAASAVTVAAATIASLVSGDGNAELPAVVFLFALGFGVIGFLDDFVKVAKHRNLGLTVIQKLVLQVAWSLAYVSYLRLAGMLTPNVYIPFAGVTIPIDWTLYMVLAVLAIVATVNAVNFTDGVDGLLGTVSLPVMVFFAVLGVMRESLGVSAVAAGVVGGIAGFLVYNFNPAKIFMGDTGSLFLGGMVCALAFACDAPLAIPIVGLIYVIEILSVVLQVVYFKATHGKRLFRMAPIHHHFEMGGWSEKKLCCVFGLVTVVMCVVAYLGMGGLHTV